MSALAHVGTIGDLFDRAALEALAFAAAKRQLALVVIVSPDAMRKLNAGRGAALEMGEKGVVLLVSQDAVEALYDKYK